MPLLILLQDVCDDVDDDARVLVRYDAVAQGFQSAGCRWLQG